jgi:GTP cyclohydrolase I
MNRERIAEGIRLFLEGLVEGEPDQVRVETATTPERVAAAWTEDLLIGYATDPTEVLRPEPAGDARGLVAVGHLAFTSVCAHHLLPFGGLAGVAFLPGETIAGLGQIARLIDVLSRRLQIQERLTGAIADEIERALRPRGALVLVEAEHFCVAARGPRKPGHRLTTREARGAFAEDAGARDEAMALLGGAPPDP